MAIEAIDEYWPASSGGVDPFARGQGRTRPAFVVPVSAGDPASGREVCGEAAVYFPLFDFKELAAEIERVSGDLSLRVKLAKASAARVRAVFSWDTHVRRILDSASELNAGRRRRYSQKD